MDTTQTNNTWIYISLISLISIFSCFFFANPAVAKVKAENLEGYEVIFTSVGHEKEREIVYQHCINSSEIDREELKREYIDVDLYDIDNDGKKEIVYMISGTPEAGYCGNRGCTFNILKQSSKTDQDGNPIYVPIRWNDPKERQIHTLVLNKVKILKSTTLGMHDLLLDLETIWKWQGTYYKRVKTLKD